MIESLPSADRPHAERFVRARPTRRRWVFLCVLYLGALASLGPVAGDIWADLTPVGRLACGMATLFLVFGPIDFAQRVYEFRRHVVRWRLLFVWIETAIPFGAIVLEEDSGRVELLQEGTFERILGVPKEFNPGSGLVRELDLLYGESGLVG